MPTELFANNAVTTVSSGGTTAPAAGTTETWTVASSAKFPAASSSANPARQFAVVDSAAQTEIIRVIDVSGTSWTVIRGVEGTTPVAHTTGFTVAAIVTNWGLKQLKAGADLVALRQWYAALADVQNSPADVVVFGDSIVEGANVTDPELRWVNQMRDQIRATYPVQGVGGGPNYLPVNYVGTVTDAAVLAGSPPLGLGGLGWRSVILSTASHSATFNNVTGTSFKVWYTRGTGTGVGSYQVTGPGFTGAVTTFATVNAAGTTDDGQTALITFPSRGTYTVTIKWSSGGGVYFQGLAVYDGDETKGVRLWESGWFGQTTSGWVGALDQSFITGRYGTPITPDLVVIALGTNDIVNLIPAATTKANLLQLITYFRNAQTVPPSFLLVAYPQRDLTGVTPVDPWARYVQVMAEIADTEDDVAILDMTERMPAVQGDVLGLYSDSVHPSAKGQASIGATVANFISEDRKPGAANLVRTKVLSLTPTANATAASGDLWSDPTTTPNVLKFHDGSKVVNVGGWEMLWSGTLAAAATTLTSGTLAARDELLIAVRVTGQSAVDLPALRFNGDTAANYRSRYITVPAVSGVVVTDVPSTSTSAARLSGVPSVVTTMRRTMNVQINNRLADPKVGLVETGIGSAAAATQTGIDLSGQFEWVNTAAQITSVQLLTMTSANPGAAGTGTFSAGTGFIVFGRNL